MEESCYLFHVSEDIFEDDEDQAVDGAKKLVDCNKDNCTQPDPANIESTKTTNPDPRKVYVAKTLEELVRICHVFYRQRSFH